MSGKLHCSTLHSYTNKLWKNRSEINIMSDWIVENEYKQLNGLPSILQVSDGWFLLLPLPLFVSYLKHHTFTSHNICYFISFQSVSILYKCIQFCMLLCGGYKGNHTIIYFSLMIVWAWEQGWKWTHMLLIAHPKPLKTQFNMMCVHLCAKLYGTFSVNI